ncbi:MAG: hypothetical protein ACOCRK_05420 [bacterium]
MSINDELKRKLDYLNHSNQKKQLSRSLRNNLKELNVKADVYTRIKDYNKAIEKIERKGYTKVDQLTDLCGGKVVVNNIEDIYKFKNSIESHNTVYEMNDYIEHPQKSGYQSLHMDADINGNRVELQIKTQEMDKAQNITHDTLYKNDLTHREELSSYINNLSKQVYDYYTNTKTVDFKDLKSNPILSMINKEKQKIINNHKSFKKQFEMIKSERQRLDRAKIYFDSINKTNDKKRITLFKDNLKKQCKIDSIDQYHKECETFKDTKNYFSKIAKNMQELNKDKLQLLNNLKKQLMDLEHKDINKIYPNIDKNTALNISTLNKYSNKTLKISEIKDLQKQCPLAKKVANSLFQSKSITQRITKAQKQLLNNKLIKKNISKSKYKSL